jgi:hypothetical protein
MITAADMLELYRAEKEAMDFPCDPFMSFADWKKEYVAEYRRNHVTVDVKVAMAEADRIVQEAEAELDGFLNTDEEIEMTESTNVATTNETTSALDANLDEQAKRDARNARRRELRAAKKAAEAKPEKPKAAPKAKAASKARTPRSESKTAKAREVFTRMYGNHPRKDVIDAFINEVGLTANGASTYYQKLKKEV